MMSINNLKASLPRLNFAALLCFTCFLGYACMGQQQMLMDPPAALKPVPWTAGPAKAKLGNIAEIEIPQGYGFLNQDAARTILERMNNPVPKNLVGILAPASSEWFAILEFTGTGYMKDAATTKLDEAAMMNTVRSMIERQNSEISKPGGMPISSAEWALKPVFDPAQNKLEYAIKAGSPDRMVVNYSVRLLGRHGVLDVVAVQPYRADIDLSPLRQIARGISFQKGEAYADYQAGDVLASSGLNDLVVTPAAAAKPSPMVRAVNLFNRHRVLAASGILVAVAGIGITFVLIRKRNRRSRNRERRFADNGAYSSAASANQIGGDLQYAGVAAGNGNGNGNGHAVASHNGKPSKHADRKRRKHFSYNSFYSDMVMGLTRWNYVGGFGTFTSEYPNEVNSTPFVQRTNNGGSPKPTHVDVLAVESSRLIENQQKLIEGLRKLVEEQNRLIEEKNKLIDAENRVLEKQAELLEEQQLL
jgi:uncharacterized membrane-anchored protein